ncbi:MAG: hypothetical protein ACI9WC_003401 [Arenicella sp.]|jgi:hypothetical protein
MNLDRFLQIRRPLEVGFWVVLLGIISVSEMLVQIMDADRNGVGTQVWEIVSWEASSMIVVLALIPLIIYFDNRVPIRWSNLKVSISAHAGFSIIFSMLHVSTMVVLRKLVYWLNDSYYDFGNVFEQFLYEYLKDARSYAISLALIYLYRHIVLRLQGEASLLGVPDHADQKEHEPEPERILVKKLGREFLVKINDIERIEASGNYVNLHIAKRVYPLRETLTKIEQRLDSTKFKRIHRSHMINLDQVEEIRPFESGDAQVLLNNGVTVPMSRTYRHQFADNHW